MDRLTLPAATLLGDSYRIEHVIASGGFGITYAAEDIHLGMKVAIKEYCPADFSARDDRMRVRPKSERHKQTFEWGLRSFLQEARTLARFKHPSIVRVTRVFEANSTAYMVMEFEEGRSFEGWLRHLGRPPTQDELDRIARPLLEALDVLHAQSFLHRDIAPDNVIIRTDGTPVLLDFGAARRAVGEVSRALTGIVKMGYSPQEQYTTDSRQQGPWTDIYAFGATLYRAVTGVVPVESTRRSMGDNMVPAANAAIGSFRPGFLTAIDSCLAMAPSQRPASMAQLSSLMFSTEIPTGRAGQSAPSPNGWIAPPNPSRWRWIVVATGVLLTGAAGGFWYSHWTSDRTVTGRPDQPLTKATNSGPVSSPSPIYARDPTLRVVRGFQIERPSSLTGRILTSTTIRIDASKPDPSVEVCAELCEARSGCTGFDISLVYGKCTLYDPIEKKSALGGYISGIKPAQ